MMNFKGQRRRFLKHWLHGSGTEQITDMLALHQLRPTDTDGGPAFYFGMQISDALDFLTTVFHTDPERMYLEEGTSMSGFGAKYLATFWPVLFPRWTCAQCPGLGKSENAL